MTEQYSDQMARHTCSEQGVDRPLAASDETHAPETAIALITHAFESAARTRRIAERISQSRGADNSGPHGSTMLGDLTSSQERIDDLVDVVLVHALRTCLRTAIELIGLYLRRHGGVMGAWAVSEGSATRPATWTSPCCMGK